MRGVLSGNLDLVKQVATTIQLCERQGMARTFTGISGERVLLHSISAYISIHSSLGVSRVAQKPGCRPKETQNALDSS